jgi:hypothetical protein
MKKQVHDDDDAKFEVNDVINNLYQPKSCVNGIDEVDKYDITDTPKSATTSLMIEVFMEYLHPSRLTFDTCKES